MLYASRKEHEMYWFNTAHSKGNLERMMDTLRAESMAFKGEADGGAQGRRLDTGCTQHYPIGHVS